MLVEVIVSQFKGLTAVISQRIAAVVELLLGSSFVSRLVGLDKTLLSEDTAGFLTVIRYASVIRYDRYLPAGRLYVGYILGHEDILSKIFCSRIVKVVVAAEQGECVGVNHFLGLSSGPAVILISFLEWVSGHGQIH